jgi:hypothetical protein
MISHDVNLKSDIEKGLQSYEVKVAHKINAADRRRLPIALMKARYAIEMGAKRKIILDSWLTCGLEGQCVVNPATVLSQHHLIEHKHYNLFNYHNMMHELPDAIRIFMSTGTLTDAYMNSKFDICKLNKEGRDRDDRVTHQRRCLILNHSKTVAKYVEAAADTKKREAELQVKRLEREEKEES